MVYLVEALKVGVIITQEWGNEELPSTSPHPTNPGASSMMINFYNYVVIVYHQNYEANNHSMRVKLMHAFVLFLFFMLKHLVMSKCCSTSRSLPRYPQTSGQ